MTSKPHIAPSGVNMQYVISSEQGWRSARGPQDGLQPTQSSYALASSLAVPDFADPLDAAAASRWCESRVRRLVDAAAASVALAVLSPVLLSISAGVRLTSPGPSIFRQKRVGCGGVEFTILKFRTMLDDPEGCKRSSCDDRRITPLGRLLRKYKLDELPQLINVIRGDMSLVGPRPKLRGHQSLDIYFRPGITGAATVAFAGEERLLRHVPEHLLEDCHRQLITPRKLELDLEYMARASFRSDLRLIWKTVKRANRYTSLDELGAWQPSASYAPQLAALPAVVSSTARFVPAAAAHRGPPAV